MSLGLGYAFERTSGSEESYRTQYNLKDGLVLEDLNLKFAPSDGAPEKLSLFAWGFGGSEPSRRARLVLGPAQGWRVELDYARRESYFGLKETDLLPRHDDWAQTRWKGKIAFDGWSFAKLTLLFRHGIRTGTVSRGLYGLNEVYPLRVDLDEKMTEGTLRLETRTLPVHLLFEQAYAEYVNRDRIAPDGSTSLTDPNDPDLLVGARSDRNDETTVPTSRLSAMYRGGPVELLGSFLYSKADTDAKGTRWTDFAIGGGRIGQVEVVDDLIGSASRDSRSGDLRAGVSLGAGFTLRAFGELRDSTTDSSLLGQRLLHLTNPQGGTVDIPGPVSDSGFFDVKDLGARAELEKAGDRWSVWAGGFARSRQVSWRISEDAGTQDIDRKTTGGLVGGSLSLAQKLRANVEYEHGTFSQYVFRTDPETVDRVRGRFTSDLGSGLKASFVGRYERGDNPPDVSGLAHQARSYGLGVSWDAAAGASGAGLQIDKVNLSTDTGLLLPSGGTDVSRYRLDLLTVSLRARHAFGPVRLELSGTRCRDDGDTWPLTAWTVDGRVTIALPAGTELSGFAQYRFYDEQRASRDDFEVLRYGLALRWSLDR